MAGIDNDAGLARRAPHRMITLRVTLFVKQIPPVLPCLPSSPPKGLVIVLDGDAQFGSALGNTLAEREALVVNIPEDHPFPLRQSRDFNKLIEFGVDVTLLVLLGHDVDGGRLRIFHGVGDERVHGGLPLAVGVEGGVQATTCTMEGRCVHRYARVKSIPDGPCCVGEVVIDLIGLVRNLEIDRPGEIASVVQALGRQVSLLDIPGPESAPVLPAQRKEVVIDVLHWTEIFCLMCTKPNAKVGIIF